MCHLALWGTRGQWTVATQYGLSGATLFSERSQSRSVSRGDTLDLQHPLCLHQLPALRYTDLLFLLHLQHDFLAEDDDDGGGRGVVQPGPQWSQWPAQFLL